MSQKKSDSKKNLYSYPIEEVDEDTFKPEDYISEFYVPRSPDDALLSDIINSILEKGSPQYSSELFVNETFGWYEPKKKIRTRGGKLEFPVGTFVGRFKEVHQFYNKNSVLNFIKDLDEKDPFVVRSKVQEKFPSCAIGVAGGRLIKKLSEGEVEPVGDIVNIIWLDEKTRIYYDLYKKKQVCFAPKVIVI